MNARAFALCRLYGTPPTAFLAVVSPCALLTSICGQNGGQNTRHGGRLHQLPHAWDASAGAHAY
eukprot:365402-Chlamydomonas_euryale.AAC.8